MISFRLIARLDIKAPNLVKTRNLEGLRVVGDPAEYAERYDRSGIDELLYLDIVASLYGRNSLHDLLERTTARVFTPITVAGGVRSVNDAIALLRAGADKIAVNTAAAKRPNLINELAGKFGSQAVVLQLDAKRDGNSWQSWCDGGREPTGRDAILWTQECVARGAGEVLVTSIDREGTRSGCDLDLAGKLSRALPVPVVISGGVGRADDLAAAAGAGAQGCAMAGALHHGFFPLMAARQSLRDRGFTVRMAA